MKRIPVAARICLLLSLLLAACSMPSAPKGETATLSPTPTDTSIPPTETPVSPSPTPTEPSVTQINVDGDPADWAGYQVLVMDPEGDHEGGGFDIAAVRAFTNDQYLYVLIETHEPPTDYVQVDIDASAGERRYILSFQQGSSAFMGDVTSGQFVEIGEVVGSLSAVAEAMEYKIPLSAFEDVSDLSLSVRPMGGTCCEPPDWYAIDDVGQTSVARLNEKEPAAGVSAIPQVCTDKITPPIPFGQLELAPVDLAEEGYAAEWFVAPGAFNMPQEILLTPDGEILVYAVRGHTLSRLSLDGTVSPLAENVLGYLGDVDAEGNVYLHMHPNGTVTRVSPQGTRTVIAQSPDILTACDSGFGLGPDGNLYVAVSRCADKADLFQITTSGRITRLAKVPQIQALRTMPGGRVLAATRDTIGELSLEDYSLTTIGVVPGGDISPGGMAFDDSGNVYVATGSRRRGGKLFRLPCDGSQTSAELVAEIPENGLSGIEWLPSTGEIIGGQLRQGGVLAVSPSGEIREIVSGNGIITPMGIGFSPCGELAVPNDDGGMMTLVDPAGQVSWLMDYLSFTPPLPYVTFDPDGTLYASEAEPMPHTPKRVAVMPPGGVLKTLMEGDFPSGLARRANGVLFVSETTAGRITQVFPDGSTEVFVEGMDFPQELAFDRAGNLYAVTGPAGFTPDPALLIAPLSGDRVVLISPEGEVTPLFDLPGGGATGLAVSPQGDLFVSISTMGAPRSEIVRISQDGTPTTFASGFEDAVGLAFDLAGNLYVSDVHRNGIVRIGGFPHGTLSGVVRDESGAPIEGARVKVFSIDPIVVGQIVFTDAEGRFNLPAAPRTYSVTITAEEYETTTLEGIKVVADQGTSLEIKLERR